MAVSIDQSTGCLLIDGAKVFPIALSNPPPLGGKTPSGTDGWAEVASAGVNFIRTRLIQWDLQQIDAQIAQEKTVLDAAGAHGFHCWLQLGEIATLPTSSGSPNEQLLTRIANGLKGHLALGVYKGVDEPANPNRPSPVPAAGLVRAYQKLKALDPDHPVEITQAPLGTAASLTPYRPAFDITGADIYPVSYPPGEHSDLPNKDISVVGDVTRKMITAAGGKPVWMTLQIAWSGVIQNQPHPDIVPRFPTFHEERFMVYQSIVAGARGLVFYGGDFTQVMRPRDALLGWNWFFWQLVLHPLLIELTSPSVGPALVAPDAPTQVTTSASDVDVITRKDGQTLYVIAVRRSPTATNKVSFSGLPRRSGGAHLARGEVMFEYVQRPLSPPVDPTKQAFRLITVANDGFQDWFGPHDSRVYRFSLA
ncbi:MAG: hypothetical protein WAQ33_00195 [Gaiellaceae bacterium]